MDELGGSEGDADPAEAALLLQRRTAAARRVRGTRNVRPVPARFSNRGSARGSTTLVFWLARPGRVVFTVLGEAPSCRVLGSFAARGRAGVNRVRYRGRLDGRPLPPGRYTLVPRVYRRDSVTRLERVTIEILPERARTPARRRTALVPVECPGDVLAGVWDSAAAGGARLPETFAAETEPASAAGVKAARKTIPSPLPVRDEPDELEEEGEEEGEEESVAVEVPFYTDGQGGRISVLSGVLIVALCLACMLAIRLVDGFLHGRRSS